MKHTSNQTALRILALLLTVAFVLPALGLHLFAADPVTVKLTADSSAAITINAGENKILDLAGHNLTGVVTNNGTLTIIDSVGGGKIGFTITESGKDITPAVKNYGTLTFDGATIVITATANSTYPTGIYNYSGATMTMKSGTIEAVNTETSAAYCYSIINEGTITEISGGTLRAIKNNNTSALNIMCINNRNGGVIKLISGGELYAYSKANNGWAMAIRNQSGAKIEKITGGVLRAEVDGTGGSDPMAIRNENGYVGEISGGLIEGITRGSNSNSEAVGLNNVGGQTVEKITGGTISAKALNGGSAKAFALRNEGNATVKEISGGNLLSYTNAGEWAFGIDNWKNGIINKISGGNINVVIDHQNAAPNGIAIANKGRIDEISGGYFYCETVCNNGAAMGLRNQEGGTVTKISGGTLYARAIRGNECKAYGIYNQNGTVGEITGDAEIVGYTTATQYSFGIWNDSTINTISGGTIVGVIERSTGGYNTLAISNDNSGVIKSITGGVFYAYSSSPEGDTYAIRTRSNAKIENITGGAFYINKPGDNRILRTEGNGKVTYAGGYALTNGYSASGYQYVIPTGADVKEAYTDGQALKIATVTKDSAKVAEYKLYGTDLYVATVGDEKYVSVEEAAKAAKEGDTVTLLSNVASAKIPAGAKITLDLGDYRITDLTVADGATVTVTNGFIDGKISGKLTAKDVAVAGDSLASITVANGYATIEKADSKYAYVVPADSKIVELYNEYAKYVVQARVFDKDGKVVSTIGSTKLDGYKLAGWATKHGDAPTVADSDVKADHGTLYGAWVRHLDLYFLGSSVTYGSATGGRSFIEELADLYSIDYTKQAVSGTTLVDNGSSSYVQRMIATLPYLNAAPDAVIVQLSTNDASQNKPLGTVSDSTKLEDFDTSTIIGAIEYILGFVEEEWHRPVIFYTNPCYNNANYEKMIAALYELQKKWDFRIVDFYYYADMEELPSATLSSYMADAIHPNAQGYKWMAGVMGKLIVQEHCDHGGLWEITDPTCTEDGYTECECVICGKVAVFGETDELGHDYKDGKCTVCGEADPDYVPPKTEEPPVSTDKPVDPPRTGDLLTVASVLALIALAGIVCFSKKRRIN